MGPSGLESLLERPKRNLYVDWASVFMKSAPVVRTGLANKLDLNSDWASNILALIGSAVHRLLMQRSGVYLRKLFEAPKIL